MPILDFLQQHIPAVGAIQNQIDGLRRTFLAIPATTSRNRTILNAVRAKTNDASDVAKVDALLAQARAVDSGFQSVTGQFAYFDDLRKSGANPAEQIAAGASLASGVQTVIRQSDAVTKAVGPLAAKYGVSAQLVTSTGGSVGGGLMILGVAGIAMLFLLRPKRGRR